MRYGSFTRGSLSRGGGRIPLERVTASVRGWVNHARYGNTVGLRRAVLESLSMPTRGSGVQRQVEDLVL